MSTRAFCLYLAAALSALPSVSAKDWESPEFRDEWLYQTDLVIPPVKQAKT
jgi:hypothetical protein